MKRFFAAGMGPLLLGSGWLAILVALQWPSDARGGQALRGEPLPWPLVFSQQWGAVGQHAAPATARAWAFRPRRAGSSRVVRLDPDGSLRVLSKGFAWAGEPALSHDGQRILFSGSRDADEPRAIWEMQIEGAEPRRVSDDPGDCGEPEYMSRNALNVPEFDELVRWYVYTSDHPPHPDPRLDGLARKLYARSLQPVPGRGIVTWRTTFNPGSAISPTMLQDGRVLYSAWSHYGQGPGSHQGGRFFLMAMNWAGTGLNALFGTHEGPRLRTMAAEMPDRTVVFVESDGEHPDGSGRLAQLSWRRPLHSHRVLSHGRARYRDPGPLPDGRTIVACAGGHEEAGGADAGEGFGLYLFDRAASRRGPLLYDHPEYDDVDPLAVARRPEPMGRIATVWTGRFDTGDIQCMDVYDSDRPELQSVPRGSIRAVRVLQALPLKAGGGDPAAAPAPRAYAPRAPFGATATLRTRVLGEVPVMPDGSFHLRLPADTPFTFQTLDADGVAVRTMRSWIWLRPWNRRSCMGCHEDKEMAPQNRVTMAMQSLLLPELGEQTARDAPDFVHHVMPIIRARCYGACHGPKVPMVDMERIVLDSWAMPPYNRAYRALVPRYVRPGMARESRLMQLLRGRERVEHAERAHAALLESELRTIAAWIDLGALWDATKYEIPIPPDEPGGDGGPGPAGCCGPGAAAGRGPGSLDGGRGR